MLPIYIVGEAFGEHEEREGQPFVGPSGSVLNGLLHQHGVRRRDVIVDNVFNLRPPHNDIESFFTKETGAADTSLPPLKPKLFVRKDLAQHVYDLRARIEAAKPNIVFALGNTPLWALTGLTGMKKFRGSPLLCSFAPIKLIASWHPAAVLRQWDLRPILYADMEKVLDEARTPEFTRPERFVLIAPTLEEIEDFYHRYAKPAEYLAADIETKFRTITEIGFAAGPSRCIVIPFYSRERPDGNYWRSFAEEKAAWRWTERYLQLPNVWQNGSYDLKYLWQGMGIKAPKFRGDSMLLHHALQPELEKGLGFLGSVYTREPSWKFMRTEHDSVVKKGD